MKKMNIIDGMTAVLEHQRSQSAQPGRALAVIADIPTDVVSGRRRSRGICAWHRRSLWGRCRPGEGRSRGRILGRDQGRRAWAYRPADRASQRHGALLSETTAGLLNTLATLRDMLDSGEAEFRKDR